MTRIAAIDCGTNSLRLLITDCVNSPDGTLSLHEVSQRMEIVRLGQGVDRTGELAADALARTDVALQGFAEELAAQRVEQVRVVATSALRDVRNAQAFVDMVCCRLGVVPEIISGQAEAALAFGGATRGLSEAEYPCPRWVIDIGGGSTEMVNQPIGGDELRAVSMDVGAVRLTERWFQHDPPTDAQLTGARGDVAAALGHAFQNRAAPEHAPQDRGGVGTVIGVAGSVTTVAAIALGLTSYQPDRLHHVRLDAAVVSRIAADLLVSSRAEREANPAIHPGRVGVIAAGALILDEVLRWLGASELVVSERDILHGITYGMLADITRFHHKTLLPEDRVVAP
ncbi:MAG: exopolyphosphatase [Mycobacteriales bacterium]